jgi:hypothetical protein
MSRDHKRILVQPLGFDCTIGFAAEQLCKYVRRIAPVSPRVLPAQVRLATDSNPQFVLATAGNLRDLGLKGLPGPSATQDTLALIAHAGTLYLSGSNPRSVLFAVYRFLEELGARFLRPGRDGEWLPKLSRLTFPRKPIIESAATDHRGICIEGSPRLEHVLEILDWMVKKKMNTFQLQFQHAGVFWRRGLNALDTEAVTTLSTEDCEALDEQVIAAVRKRGMILHRVGHGWTSAALGIEGNDWDPVEVDLTRKQRNLLAKVNGRRDIYKEIPSLTELCYGNPAAREAFVAGVVNYACRHSEVDVLHVWLSDGFNNKCECDTCSEKSPSDWYAVLVNAICRQLKQDRLQTRIVFLGYVDLLWPPRQEKYAMDNVIFMFAPISRCFRHALADSKCFDDTPHHRPALNHWEAPTRNRAFGDLALLWKRRKLPDAFLFDYHMMWQIWHDGFAQDIGTTLARDMTQLAELGLNGLVSCQPVRAFYPLPYAPNAMAELLWNPKRGVAQTRKQIMTDAFGKWAHLAESYFTGTIKHFRLGRDAEHRTLLSEELTEKHRSRLETLDRFARENRRKLRQAAGRTRCGLHRLSLEMLALHAHQVQLLARIGLAGIEDDRGTLEKIARDYPHLLRKTLKRYGSWIDPLMALPVRQALIRRLGESRLNQLWAAHRL